VLFILAWAPEGVSVPVLAGGFDFFVGYRSAEDEAAEEKDCGRLWALCG
jgi:hypothetical protein